VAERRRIIAAYKRQPASGQRRVVSIYDSRRGVILLPQGWSGDTPAEISMLVHEVTHHMQFQEGLRYACPQEREKLAYAAQEKWLGMFRTTLQAEFEIDANTLFISTNCPF